MGHEAQDTLANGHDPDPVLGETGDELRCVHARVVDPDHHDVGVDVIRIRLEAGDPAEALCEVTGQAVVLGEALHVLLESQLGRGGEVAGLAHPPPQTLADQDGTLVVLTAEKSLIQAGMKAERIDRNEDGDEGWKSNILRNTEQVAILVADIAGKLAVETQLIAKQPELAESLASIVRGLISLTLFNTEMDPDVSAVLQGTRVDVDGSQLNIKLAVDPEQFVAVLDD